MAENMKALKRTRGGRERVLAAAAELFGAKTLAGTSLQMIADRLGMSKPAIYHHFRSREDIVTALMEPVVTETNAALAELDAAAPEDRAALARTFYREFLIRHRAVINMVFFDRAAMPGSLPEAIDELVDRVAAHLSLSDGDIDRARGTMLVYGMAAFVARHPELSDAEILQVLEATSMAAQS